MVCPYSAGFSVVAVAASEGLAANDWMLGDTVVGCWSRSCIPVQGSFWVGESCGILGGRLRVGLLSSTLILLELRHQPFLP